MTKPAAFVLQLTGLVMLLYGWTGEAPGVAITGLVLILIGGIGIRRRLKK